MSLTIISVMVLILNQLAKMGGLEIEFLEKDIQTTLHTLLDGLSVIGIWFGRVRAGGITWLGARK